MSHPRERPCLRRLVIVAAALVAGCASFAAVAAASNVATGLQGSGGDVSVPTWLYLLTGGAVIGASGLLSMLVTDRQVIDDFHDWSLGLPGRETVLRPLAAVVGALGLVGLVLVVYVGFTGPAFANANFAVLVVFVGVRGGLTILAYAVGNPWPALNPWRRIAEALPNGFRDYPDELASWPAVVGFLALVWVEIVAPVSEVPTVLAVAVVAYSAYTVAGAVVFSPAAWFRRADPVSVWFRLYGAVAPLQRTDDGLEFGLPGARLRDADVVADASGVAFVLLVVWELTYSGLIVTPPGARLVEFVVGLGVPPAAAYLGLLLLGYAAFVAAYLLAARRARRRASTYVDVRYLVIRFAPPLLGIAAGYHLAHYANFTLALAPSLGAVLASPLSPPANPLVLVLPSWFGTAEVAFILLGHLLAIWAAHTAAFDLFPGRLQAIKSQYPFILVMVGFTMVSLWLVSLPTAPPPFVGAG